MRYACCVSRPLCNTVLLEPSFALGFWNIACSSLKVQADLHLPSVLYVGCSCYTPTPSLFKEILIHLSRCSLNSTSWGLMPCPSCWSPGQTASSMYALITGIVLLIYLSVSPTKSMREIKKTVSHAFLFLVQCGFAEYIQFTFIELMHK